MTDQQTLVLKLPHLDVTALSWGPAAGTLVLIATLIALIPMLMSGGSASMLGVAFGKTVAQLRLPIVTIAFILSIATVMNYSGMTSSMALALALWFAPPPLPRLRPQAMRELLPYGGPAALACIAWTGFRNGDYAIIGAKPGVAQAGFYWRGYQLSVEYQRKISVLMGTMAFPMLARTQDAEQLHALRRRMVQLMTVVLFPLLVMLAMLAPVMNAAPLLARNATVAPTSSGLP